METTADKPGAVLVLRRCVYVCGFLWGNMNMKLPPCTGAYEKQLGLQVVEYIQEPSIYHL